MRQFQRKRYLHLYVFIVTILVLFIGFPINAEAGKVNEQFNVSDSVKYKDMRYADKKVNQAVRVLEINAKDPYTHVDLGMHSNLNGRKSTTALARDYHKDGSAVLGAINGSFFHINGPSYQLGMPMNLVTKGNRVHQAGEVYFNEKHKYVNEPIAFGVNANGKNVIDHFEFDLNYIHNNKKYPITATNKERLEGNTILYTAQFPRSTTETNEWGTEIVVTLPTEPTLELGSTVTGKVASIRQFGDTKKSIIPKNGIVISAHGRVESENISHIQVGDAISLETNIDSKWKNASFMLASGSMLVKDGKISLTMDPNSENARYRAPRTAIAIDKTGEKAFFVTVDGRQKGYSAGMTIKEFAKHLSEMGVDRALNLDGGGSTTMSVRYPGEELVRLANKPSDKWERSVPNILMAVSTQVFPDVSYPYWGLEEIMALYERETINGYPDGTFRPEKSIKRQHAAIMLANEFGLDTKNISDPGFKDVKKTDDAYAAIAAAVEAELIVGKGAGVFGKEDNLTREEMAVLIQRAFKIQSTDTAYFPDVKDKEHWAYDAINAIAHQKITTGYPDGTYGPGNNVTRAEFSAFLVRGQSVSK